MREFLVVIAPSANGSERAAVTRAAPPAQTISDRVFTSVLGDAALADLRSMPGVAAVVSAGETAEALPKLDDAEMLFAQAWLSRAGKTKQRPGEGLDWDTPPMVPPDPPRQK